jgi:UPF0755 protein
MNAPLKSLLWAAGLFLFLLLGAGSLFLPADLGGGGPPVRVTLKPGLATRAIGQELRRAGLVRSSDAFTLVALLSGRASELQAGTYEFRGTEGLGTLVDRMARGDVLRVAVTIPEGFNSREIAGRVAPILGCTPAEFLGHVHDAALSESLGVAGASLEGYLYPDTYHLIPGTDARRFVRRLAERTMRLFDERFAARADSLGMDRHRILTLASLVEAEARVDDERSRIAAVFWNRLREGMKLQSDPTVAYVLGRRPERIYYRDLEVESPYNTYRVEGLPPGPICSPGEASIEATLNPLPGCRDLYFVATGDGRHLFSTTNDAHNAARRRVALERDRN